jgi:hypothetical protein
MQASYDAFVMLKIINDAGGDLLTEPIKFYCYEWGGQIPIFYEALDRIFGKCETSYEQDDNYEEASNIRIPFPELKEFIALVTPEEAKMHIRKFNQKLNMICDHFEMEMKGSVQDHHLNVTLTGSYGIHSSFLKKIVEIRKEVLDVIRERKERMIQRLRNVVMMKMLFDRLGTTVDVSMGDHTNLVFSRLMEHCNFNLPLEAADSLSYEDMLKILGQVLNQVEHKKIGEGEAA